MTTSKITAADFKKRFRSLKTAHDDNINAVIIAAELEISQPVWTDLYTEGVLNLAAHKLTIDPAGMKARKKDQTGQGVYLAEYNRLMALVGIGVSVSGPTVTNADLGIS